LQSSAPGRAPQRSGAGRFYCNLGGHYFWQLFAADVSEHWHIPVLVLGSADDDFELTNDSQVELTEGAAALVSKLKSLIAMRAKRSA
jgi:hypothetical protein